MSAPNHIPTAVTDPPHGTEHRRRFLQPGNLLAHLLGDIARDIPDFADGARDFGSGQRPFEPELARHALDAVSRVDILHTRNLVTRRAPLARDDGAVCEEELPYPVPPLAVLGADLGRVGEPVAVPAPDGRTVMYADGVDGLDLETSSLEFVDEPKQRRRGVGAGEDVLVHEETPDEVFILPRFSQAGNLEKEDAVVREHLRHLAEKGRKVADTDVLGHLETGDLVVDAAGRAGDVAIVHAENARLTLGDPVAAETGITPGGLVASQRRTCAMRAVMTGSVSRERTPAATDVEEAFAGLERDFLAHHPHFVVLECFEGLFGGNVADDAGGVDHAGAKEPRVEVVATVVVVPDLLFVLAACVHEHFGDRAGQKEPVEGEGEAEVGPVMAVLETLEGVTLEGDIAGEVHFVEGFHGDFALPFVPELVFIAAELQVVFHRATGIGGFFIFAWAHGGCKHPEDGEDGERGEDGEEKPCFDAAAELPGEIERDEGEERDEKRVGEAFAARCVRWQGSILDGGILVMLLAECD